MQLVSGLNPSAQRGGISPRAKATANDRAEARDHAVTKSGHRIGVFSSDSLAEMAKVVLSRVHVGSSAVSGRRDR
jgi:hypothetical protein